MVAIICTVIAAASSLAGVWLTVRQNTKVNETHRQVTVNHHSSAKPTILDRFDDLERMVEDHIKNHHGRSEC